MRFFWTLRTTVFLFKSSQMHFINKEEIRSDFFGCCSPYSAQIDNSYAIIMIAIIISCYFGRPNLHLLNKLRFSDCAVKHNVYYQKTRRTRSLRRCTASQSCLTAAHLSFISSFPFHTKTAGEFKSVLIITTQINTHRYSEPKKINISNTRISH